MCTCKAYSKEELSQFCRCFRFAVNLQLFLSRTKAKFAYRVKRGHQVTNSINTNSFLLFKISKVKFVSVTNSVFGHFFDPFSNRHAFV